MMKLISGAIYKHNYRLFTLIFVSIMNEKPVYSMLYIHRSIYKYMSAPGFQFGIDDKWYFTEQELINDFKANEWIMMDGRLRIEKMDDSSFVDYTIGGELDELTNLVEEK